MKISQLGYTFRPVTIVIETWEEMVALWDAIEGREPEDLQKQMLIDLCEWFLGVKFYEKIS